MPDGYGWDDEELVELSSLRIPSQSDRSRGGSKNRQGRSDSQPRRGTASGRNAGRTRGDANQQRRQPSPQGRERQQVRRDRNEEPQAPRRRPQRPEPQQGRGRNEARQPARRERAPQRQESHGRREFADRLAATDRRNTASVGGAGVSGWRGAVMKATGGFVNLGPSAQDREMARLNKMLRRPVTDGTIAVFSRKGGVGKTTISAYLGLTLAQERGGRIVALDGDAEAGSLGWLLAPRAPSTLSALSSAAPTPASYGELRQFTTSTPEGLEVIVGEPAEMGPISATGLEAVAAQLSRHYDLSIFDTGAGVTRATGRVLVNTARTLLLVMSPSADSVRAAERTLAWLDERPGEAMNENTNVIAVINGIPAGAKASHVERIESHFSERCNAVVRIPWDAHLATGSSNVSLELLSKETRQGFLELAATSVASLSRGHRGNGHSGARRAS